MFDEPPRIIIEELEKLSHPVIIDGKVSILAGEVAWTKRKGSNYPAVVKLTEEELKRLLLDSSGPPLFVAFERIVDIVAQVTQPAGMYLANVDTEERRKHGLPPRED